MKSLNKCPSRVIVTPLIFFCTIYPLITRLYLYDSGYELFDWFDFTTQVTDVFLGWKLITMEIVGACMCLIFCYMTIVRHERIRTNTVIVLLLAYAGLTVVSTFFSKYPKVGIRGAYEQFEPVWCTLIYVLIVCYIYLLITDRRQIQILMVALAIGSCVIGLIGFFQFFGLDIMTSTFAKYITLPRKYFATEMNTNVLHGVSYMTLYNPNYVGSYVSLLIPLYIFMSVYENNKKLRILAIIDCVLLYVCGLGCQSESARWGMSLVLIFSAAFLIWRAPNHNLRIKYGIILAIALSVIQIYFGLYLPNRIVENESTNTIDSTSLSTSSNELDEENDSSQEIVPISENLKGIETGENALRIDYGSGSFYLSYSIDDNEFIYSVTDLDGNAVALEQADDSYVITITDPRFAGIQFYAISYKDGGYGLQLLIDGKEWNFSNSLEGRDGYYYYNEYGKFDKITTAENYLFSKHGGFGSGRGFIWGETLPLLKHTLILGTGADTFALVFPQDNYVQKYLNGYEGMIISRPHNLFLQIGVQNGVLALLLFLTAVLICIFRTWKNCCGKAAAEPEHMALQMGIAGGLIGYLFTGLVNDASICITPIFWCLLGMSIVLTEFPKKRKR